MRCRRVGARRACRTSPVAVVVLLTFLIGPEAPVEHRPASPGIGDAAALQASYERWKARHETRDADRRLVLPLGYSKALSAAFTSAHGQMRLDLGDGRVSVEVWGLGAEDGLDVWLIDNRPGSGRSVKPEAGDAMVRIGRLTHQGSSATLETRLERAQLAGFEIDLVVVTRAGGTPVDGGLLFGSPTLFQRIYYSEQAGRLDTFVRRDPPAILSAPFRTVIPAPAYAQQTALATALEVLVARGEALFFEETFDGNGRTCGTCHPADNNFTLDPAFIATLPPSDPLFVAEFVPALSKHFENPTLMREFGLILENVDGFADLQHRFVMRAVSHTLALTTSLTPPPAASPGGTVALDRTTLPPVGPGQRTGWGGDGAPGSGSLRDFATGAVTQHFTKTLKRRPGKDFRLPTDDELDALEAFQRSLGRQSDLTLSALTLKPAGRGAPDPEEGKRLFNTTAKCSVCHVNAGANAAFVRGNFNFDTGVEEAPHPADATGEPRPRDGGFGTAPHPAGGFGDGTFNTPPLVEAADTGPFFHNHAAATIEDAVRFYTTSAFGDSPSARPPFGVGAIVLTEPEIAAVGAFLRTINALENIRSCRSLAEKAKKAGNFAQARKLLSLAMAETRDAIQVLKGAGLYSGAVRDLKDAREKLADARTARNHVVRGVLIDQAIAEAVRAQAAMTP